MNEQIVKELADEAGIEVVRKLQIFKNDDGTFSHVWEFPQEKFAELIVRKAMDYASRNWEHGHLLAEDLRVYFGVEK